MYYLTVVILFTAAMAITTCTEQNICTKDTYKPIMKYTKHMSTHRSGCHRTTYIVWFPVKHMEKVTIKECCPGYGGKGCLLRLSCPVTLPQNASPHCKTSRDRILEHKRLYYVLNRPKDANDPSRTGSDVLVPVLNQTAANVRVHTMFDPLEAEWFNFYFLATITGVKAIYGKAVGTFGIQQFTSPDQFLQLKALFDAGIKAINSPKLYYPTDLFLDTRTNGEYLLDRVFAAKRLAGLNPIGLKRVIPDDGEHGRKWSSLKNELNPTFDWDSSVKSVTGMSIQQSASKGRLYVADLALARDIPHVTDITDRDRNDSRVLRNETAPIALFGMKDDNGKLVLYPIAIQIDYKKDSKVYKPSDGEAWLIAKSQFETVDSIVSQMENHLTKAHLMMERICVIACRHFSIHHPLGQLLYPHCLGTIPINSNGIPGLLHEAQITHVLWGVGNTGSNEILNRVFLQQHWDDYDFPNAIKRRGMDNPEELPYYPYRDDGMTIYHLMKNYAHEYVHLYYKYDRDVIEDANLQAFANELSLKGTKGRFAATGKVNGFPAKFDTVVELKEAVARALFIIPDHSAYNFPLAEFMQFTPETPSKLYMNKDKDLTAFESLGDSGLAAYQYMSTGLLAALHFDTLLGYAHKMDDPRAKALVEKYYAELNDLVTPVLDKRIKTRLASREFGYPYFLPRLMPNSISI